MRPGRAGSNRSRSQGRSRPLTAFLLGLSAACTPEATTTEFPENRCVTSADCWAKTECRTDLGWCAATAMERPYTLVLQISPNPNSTTGRFTWKPIELVSVPDGRVNLEIPTFVAVEGLIQCQGKAIMAEAVFYPRAQSGYPIAPVSGRSSGKDPDATTNFAVRLPPGSSFDVAIQPLGVHSERCPPFRTTFEVGNESARFEPAAPELVSVTGSLVEDPKPQNAQPGQALQVRVWSKRARRVVSGTIKTQMGAPLFMLNTIPGEPNDSVLQIDLDPTIPWHEVIEVPLASGTSTGPIRIPALPNRVSLYGAIEVEENRPVPFTELVFSSYFPPPATSGGQGNLDWCQLRDQSSDSSEVACRAERSVRTDEQGNYQVELLPGRYEILVSPGSQAEKGKPLEVAATRLVLVVESQPGDKQGPYNPLLRAGAKVEGIFENPDGSPLPNVTVRSIALSASRTPNGIGSFNRPASALTDDRGQFSVTLDSGFYDVIAEPPRSSGYPWLVLPNREFDTDIQTLFRPKRTLLPPVVMTGKVTLAAMGRPMSDAVVDAYALVKDVRGYLRPVLVGTTTCDEDGEYVLALPPRLGDETPDPQPLLSE